MLKRAASIMAVSAILLSFSSCTVYSKPKSGFAGATGGEQLEKQFWSDIKSKDWKDLGPRLEPMFTFVSSSGTRDRAAALEQWKTWDVQSVSLADVQVQTAGGDFIVTASVTLTGTIGGQPAPSQVIHTMTVWQQVSKGFVAVAHSEAQ
jgi:hypothetical protein